MLGQKKNLKVYGIAAAVVIILVVLAVNGQSNDNKVSYTVLKDMMGKPAPDFTITDHAGNMFALSSQRGKNVILFFSEGAMCYPSCWNQIMSLAHDTRFSNNDVVAVSIVTDTKQEWDDIVKYQPKLQTNTLLFDTDKAASMVYGVLNLPSSMHKGYTPGHTYFVIDKNGIITFAMDDPTMGINNDVLASKLQ
jgi:peroxiredoxin